MLALVVKGASMDALMKTYTIQFTRKNQDPTVWEEDFASKDEAVAIADKESTDWAGHVDFTGGQFRVWEHDSENEDANYLVHETSIIAK